VLKVPDNCTWDFRNADGKPFPVPMFEPPTSPNATVAMINPEFERLFTILFKAVDAYLERMGWAEQGNWVQVTDEPGMNDPSRPCALRDAKHAQPQLHQLDHIHLAPAHPLTHPPSQTEFVATSYR